MGKRKKKEKKEKKVSALNHLVRAPVQMISVFFLAFAIAAAAFIGNYTAGALVL